MIIQIIGLPGSGKTTLAKALKERINAVHFNADEIRKEVNKNLGFTPEDRIEHAKRMGILCDIVVRSGQYVIADFVCPTEETRAAFGECTLIYMDTIKEGRFEDTNKLFVPPIKYSFKIMDYNARDYSKMFAEHWEKVNVG